jgi:hypothetical protein
MLNNELMGCEIEYNCVFYCNEFIFIKLKNKGFLYHIQSLKNFLDVYYYFEYKFNIRRFVKNYPGL